MVLTPGLIGFSAIFKTSKTIKVIEMKFLKYPKLAKGDKVAILSPSFAAPGQWPHVYDLGISRMKSIFGLDPVSLPTTAKVGASAEERSEDLIAAFSDPTIKAVFASLGGDDQVMYVKNLPKDVFRQNPKPYFGYSDNTHFMNHLWQLGVPSYYGGAIMTQFAMQTKMDDFTVEYLRHALFEEGRIELKSSSYYNDVGLDWSDPENLNKQRIHEDNDGWYWNIPEQALVQGVSWGGCLESIDELLRHDIKLPSLAEFSDAVLFFETSEEIPSHEMVHRILRALGERGILGSVKALLVGRPKAWEFDKPYSDVEKAKYKSDQREAVSATFRRYNVTAPLIQNLDFGHTDPQICLPFGRQITIDGESRKIFATF